MNKAQSPMPPAAVLVTGGAGYVGSILVHDLLNEGHRVVVLDNLMFGGESLLGVWGKPGFTFIKGDVTDAATVASVMDQHPCQAVVHLAAIVGDPACKRQSELARATNWEASVNLLGESKRRGVDRFIFASTCSNYGKMADPGGYVDEESTLAPVSLYAELKVKFEQVLLEKTDDALCPTSLRFATVYGLSHRMRFDLTVNEFTKELALKKELVVFGEQFWRPYCHVADFSRAIRAVLAAPADKVSHQCFNVGDTAENYTKGMILAELVKHFPQANIKRVEKLEDPRDYRVRFEKINDQLGFKISRTVPQGIAEIKQVVEMGIIAQPEDQRYYNIPHQA